MILDAVPAFIERILTEIAKQGIEVSSLEMDHIGYQAFTDADYDERAKEFETFAEKVSEEIVNGRRVGIYKLNSPIHHKNYVIPAIELVAPKPGQICPSAFEHLEFVIPEGFTEFMKKYPAVHWDITAITQPDFPMIKLKLDTDIQVKFHLTPVLEILRKKTLKA